MNVKEKEQEKILSDEVDEKLESIRNRHKEMEEFIRNIHMDIDSRKEYDSSLLYEINRMLRKRMGEDF